MPQLMSDRQTAALRYIWLAVLLFPLLAGCSKSSSDRPSRSLHDIPPELPNAYLALSQAPIDPEDILIGGNPSSVSPERLRQIRTEITRRLTPISFDKYAEEAGGMGAAILEDPVGKLKITIGCVTSNNRTYLQIIDDELQPHLLPVQIGKSPHIRNVWALQAHSRTGIELQIGGTALSIDKLWQNLGLTKPFSEAVSLFRLSNRGKTALTVEHVSTKCGCTKVDFDDDKVLAPGESAELKVSIKTGGQENIKQTIVLHLFDPLTKVRRGVPLVLFGNQIGVLSVNPSRIDFGRQVPGVAYHPQRVTLAPSPDDRFRVTDIAVGVLPLSATLIPLGSIVNGAPSKGYALDLALDPSRAQPGQHTGIVAVSTSSTYRPIIQIPVEFCVPPLVECVPSVAAFGVVPVNSSKEVGLALLARRGNPFTATIKSPSPDCTAKIEEANGSTVVKVTGHFTKLGSYVRRLKLRVSTASGDETSELVCVGSVVEPDPAH